MLTVLANGGRQSRRFTCIYASLCPVNGGGAARRNVQTTAERLVTDTKKKKKKKKKKGCPSEEKILPVFWRALNFKDRIALKDEHGKYSYGGILSTSMKLANEYEQHLGGERGQRIAFLCPNDGSYVLAQWASWINGQIAVPLSPVHPPEMLEYFVGDCEANLLVTTPKYSKVIESIANKKKLDLIIVDDSFRSDAMLLPKSDSAEEKPKEEEESELDMTLNFQLPEGFYNDGNAMIIYTSGSTGSPKGVVVSHQNLHTQIEDMLQAWAWTPNDTILHVLPLHHTHGIVNALLCPLAVGAKCVMLPSFDVESVWKHILDLDEAVEDRINMFTGVPTMYIKMIESFTKSLSKTQRMLDFVREVCSQKMRVFISGSAPLPVQIFDRWEFITGHRILERYGMTETGMVLTNPIDKERFPGKVGKPFPSVQVRIVDNVEQSVLAVGSANDIEILIPTKNESLSGELQVRGNNVFKGYYNQPKQTEESFTEDGWFKTGDWVEYADDAYSILGRLSVDIIKTGGYKVSALHVESVIRDYPDIEDGVVVGIKDFTWGQKVAAVIAPVDGAVLNLVLLKEWMKKKLPPYEVPMVYKIVKTVPRNALGKVNKRELVKKMFPDQQNFK